MCAALTAVFQHDWRLVVLSGGKSLITQLAHLGAETIFTVPGESFLAALDALYDEARIKTVICRHEGGAAMMAAATGRLTGRPGIAFVTRGPGASNAVSGIYAAHEDEAPMLLLVGLPTRAMEDRAAFQAIDIARLFDGIAKWTAVVRVPEQICEYVARAWRLAITGRPGPVVLGFPQDVLDALTEALPTNLERLTAAAPNADQMQKISELIASAEWPLCLAGGPGWSETARKHLEVFADRFDMPVVAAFRNQDVIDNRHRCYAGHAGLSIGKKLATAIKGADLVLAIGTVLGDVTTGGFKLISNQNVRKKIVYVHPAADAASVSIATAMQVTASGEAFAAAVAALVPPAERPWSRLRQDLRTAYEASHGPAETPGAVKLDEIVRFISDRAPEDTIICNGAGNYAAFVHRFFQYKRFGTQLAPRSGSMGYGLPAAIAAKLKFPDRPVVAFAGDGCFLMTGSELATAVQYALPIIIIVANNAMYGTIRMHQELQYPGRVFGTSLVNPDFAALARSFGANAATVTETAEFESVFEQALAAGRPTVVELRIDPDAISPGVTLSEIKSRLAK